MNAFVEELKQLQISPRNAPRNQQIKVAEKLIGLLCETATESIQIDDYDIDGKKVTLPSLYSFNGFSLRFLPFWGGCFIVLDDRELQIRLPRAGENFTDYIERITTFAREYAGLPKTPSYSIIEENIPDQEQKWQTPSYTPLRKISRRQELVIKFQNTMKDPIASVGSQ